MFFLHYIKYCVNLYPRCEGRRKRTYRGTKDSISLKTRIVMSITKISKDVINEVWWKAAGRCEFRGCNKPLYENDLTMDQCKISNFAHIVADSPNGPRGGRDSMKLSKVASNIMLLCPECHRLIDHEGKDKYDEKTLRTMKRFHEERMRRLTGMSEDMQAHIITFGAPIGDSDSLFSFKRLQAALLPEFYPAEDTTFDLGGSWFHDGNWEEFWNREVANLEGNCKEHVIDRLSKWEYKRIALFGFAPMPLLVKLGTILNNKYDVEVFQRNRCGDWKWLAIDEHIDFKVNRPKYATKAPVLVLSLSFPIIERIKKTREESSIWEITIESPSPDFLRARSMLYDFGRCVERILDEICKESGGQPIDLYLSTPVACAIEFGRVWMQKVNPILRIYDLDQRYGEEDKLAITIKNS